LLTSWLAASAWLTRWLAQTHLLTDSLTDSRLAGWLDLPFSKFRSRHHWSYRPTPS